jgi:hypothetical protein
MPKRTYDKKSTDSVKKDGVQQPLIVRPHRSISGKYEIIDGNMRYQVLNDEDQVWVDVRNNTDDCDLFRLSHLTFFRKQRSTYDRAAFFTCWVKRELVKSGKKGAQARVARAAHLTEGEISQYLAICRMFNKLRLQPGSTALDFNALKVQGINKLYELSRLTETPLLLETAQKLADHPRMSIKELRRLVYEETSDDQPLSYLLAEDINDEINITKEEYEEMTEIFQKLKQLAGQVRKNLESTESKIRQTSEKNRSTRVHVQKFLHELRKLHRRFHRLQIAIEELPTMESITVHRFGN